MRKLTTEQLLSILKNYGFKELHIHHTWKPTHLTFTGRNHTDMNLAMKRYHVNVNGWSDIAQHLTLFPDGIFLTGRAFDRSPASISGRNGSKYKPLMVEMIGNFDFSGTGSYNNYGYDKLEGKQREGILALIKYFIENKGQNSIVFHRDYSSKTCPGTSNIKSELISEVVKGIQPSKSLIRLGSRGNDVKILQHNLNKLGYNVGAEDSIAGTNTIEGMKKFQKDNGLSADGIFGPNSLKKLDELLAKKDTSRKTEYIKIGDAKIIKTLPDNVYVSLLGNTLHQAGVYGINGSFYNTHPDEFDKPRAAWSIATNDGKAIGGNSMLVSYDKTIKRGTIIYFEDGSLGMAKVNNTNEYWKPHIWSISGYTVLPYMDFKGEKMPNGINYRTAHTYLGFDKEGYIYMIVRPYHMISEIVPLLRQLKIEKCIVLDGGGSSQLNHLQGKFKSNRKVNNVIAIKEV